MFPLCMYLQSSVSESCEIIHGLFLWDKSVEKDIISSQLVSPRLEIASDVDWLTHMARKIK